MDRSTPRAGSTWRLATWCLEPVTNSRRPPMVDPAALQGHPLFAHAARPAIGQLAGRAVPKFWRARQVLFQRGDPAIGLILVLEGRGGSPSRRGRPAPGAPHRRARRHARRSTVVRWWPDAGDRDRGGAPRRPDCPGSAPSRHAARRPPRAADPAERRDAARGRSPRARRPPQSDPEPRHAPGPVRRRTRHRPRGAGSGTRCSGPGRSAGVPRSGPLRGSKPGRAASTGGRAGVEPRVPVAPAEGTV